LAHRVRQPLRERSGSLGGRRGKIPLSSFRSRGAP
jgi:hypothetical protein